MDSNIVTKLQSGKQYGFRFEWNQNICNINTFKGYKAFIPSEEWLKTLK